MKVSHRGLFFLAIQVLLITVSVIYLQFVEPLNIENSFLAYCKFGSAIILILILLDNWYSKTFFTPYMIIFLMFCLFQFGVPVMYAIDSKYLNYYIETFSITDLSFGAKYSIYCILAFNIGASYCMSTNTIKQKLVTSRFVFLQKKKIVISTAKILFFSMGIIAVPFSIILFFLSMRYGYNYVKMDMMGLYNPVIKFANALFVPSGLLWLVYNEKKITERFLLLILLVYSGISMASGGRTEGLAIALVLLYYILSKRNTSKSIKKAIANFIAILVGGAIILFLLTYIAQMRMGNIGTFSILNVIENVFSEMGFNFTSILFTRDYIPSTENYKYGLSYIYSIICLIPKSIDPTGIITNINSQLPELWLGTLLRQDYSELYSFGVGYSIIAESYYNLGRYGWIAILVIGYFVEKLVKSNHKKLPVFNKYIQLVILWSLITFPRRSFITLLKSIEYDIVFVVLLIWIIYQVASRGETKTSK